MKLSLTAKLLLAFLVVGLAGTAILATLGATATAGEFSRFMFARQRQDLAHELAAYYAENRTWEGLPDDRWDLPRRRFGMRPPPGAGAPGFVPFVLTDADGSVVVAGPGYRVGQIAGSAALSQATPIEVDGDTVGSLILQRGAFGQDADEQAFLDRVNLSLWVGAAGGTAAAVILGAVLARSVTKRLAELTQAARSVAGGDLEVQVPVHSSDELGELAVAFNQMNVNLARSRDLRRQMTADIAHELRTPLSVILGHADGIRDGVLEPSEETLSIIHEEAARLERLVEDLRLLSLVDAGELPLELQPIELGELVEGAAASIRALAQEKGVELEVEAEARLPTLMLDPDRLNQVLRNLLSNALRHTPAGGSITVSARSAGQAVQIRIADTGPGIQIDDLPHLFERFYRIDKSRRRDGDGSGLGLAIARSLTEALGGSLAAANRPAGGAVFTVELPVPG